MFNKRIELPNSMRVRYECRKCSWKNETLPDDDPLFQTIPATSCVDYYGHDISNCYSSIISSSMSAKSSLYPGSIADTNVYKKRASYGYY